MNILDKIMAHKKLEVAKLMREVSLEKLVKSPNFNRTPISLKNALTTKNSTGIIAEFKRKSPSKGIINDKVAPLEVVIKYEEFGASGISILTDKDFFGGSFEDILSVRNSVNIPILRKDFMVDEFQIIEAKSCGADAILLIAAVLTRSRRILGSISCNVFKMIFATAKSRTHFTSAGMTYHGACGREVSRRTSS